MTGFMLDVHNKKNSIPILCGIFVKETYKEVCTTQIDN